MELPPEIESLAHDWGFTAIEELPGGHCSRVFASKTQVLKVPFQGEELTYGVDASLKLQDAGGPRVFRYDLPTGIVLMERLTPGINLADSGLQDEACLEIFAQAFKQISKLDSAQAMPLKNYVGIGHPLKDELLETTQSEVFLHGDLHHFNLLQHAQQWRPIDPKGLIGDPHYECVAYLRNPINQLAQMEDLHGFTERRILWLTQNLSLDPWRIAAWSLLDRLDIEDSPTEEAWRRLTPVFEELKDKFKP